MHPARAPPDGTLLGETGGVETVTLQQGELPAHPHVMRTIILTGRTQCARPDPVAGKSANSSIYTAAANLVTMAPQALNVGRE